MEIDHALSDGAGLVDAHHVDARQNFHRRQLLHEHAPLRERARRDQEREAREQYEAFGNHRHDARDHADQLVVAAPGAAELAPQQQRGTRHHRDRHVLEDLVGARLQLRRHERKAPSLRREPLGVGIGAHACRLEAPVAGYYEAPRQHLVAGGLLNRIALAGEERLVDLEPVAFEHRTVGAHLITGLELHHVVEHHVVDGDHCLLRVADYVRPRRVEHRERVELALGEVLLHDADAAR